MPSLLSLPQEILCYICGYLASEDLPSVYELALASKKCRVMTNFHRFQQINLTLVSHSKMTIDLDRWKEILERNSAFPFARELSVREYIPPGPDNGYMSPGFEDPNHGNSVDELTCLGHYYHCDITDLFNGVEEPPDTWGPFPDFVGQLSGLRHITWRSETPFPQCLLEILHDTLPRCKLHYMTFKLPSLCYNAQEPRDIDSYEYALATSPSLSSILVPVSFFDAEGNVEYNSEAAMELAAGLAPNLSQVHIVHGFPGSSPLFTDVVRQERPRWRGFFAKTRPEGLQDPAYSVSQAKTQSFPVGSPSRRRKLQSLSLSPAKEKYFTNWENQNIFSQLRVLQLWQVSAPCLRRAKGYQFPSLQALALDYERSALVDEAGSDFISSLPPLDSLSINGTDKDISLQAVFRHHGKSLRKLSLINRPYERLGGRPVTIDTVDHIRVACPHIRHLSLPILRARDPSEVAIYKSIGEIASLKELTLELHCRKLPNRPQLTIPSPNSPNFRSRDLLINAAVDSTLVSEIFNLLSRRSSLQHLRISLCAEEFSQSSWSDILDLMSRRWQCIRCEGGAVVRELGAKARRAYREIHKRDLGEFESSFRALWPDESGDWTEDWTSFPLVQDPDREG